MKLLHIAALASVGWYLMIPPPTSSDRSMVDLNAPLSKWRVFSPYGNAAECAQGQVKYAALTGKRDILQHRQFIAAQCIASDDPRLKEKP
jgi:hypothetical protein